MTGRPRVRADVEVRALADGCAVLDLDSEAVHVFNASAAFLLSLCDGEHTASDLVAELRAAVPALDPETAAADVARALEDAARCGLFVSPG